MKIFFFFFSSFSTRGGIEFSQKFSIPDSKIFRIFLQFPFFRKWSEKLHGIRIAIFFSKKIFQKFLCLSSKNEE